MRAQKIEITVPRGRSHRSRLATVHESLTLPHGDVTSVDGIPVTRPAADVAAAFATVHAAGMGAKRPVLPNEPAQRRFSARRNNSRGIVAASRYSGARARKPGGGAGSSMRTITRPAADVALT